MNQFLIKGLLTLAGKAIDGLTSKSLVITESTAQELVAGFLSNRNHPRCAVISTAVAAPDVVKRCEEFFKGYKAEHQQHLTKDGWVAMQADRGSDFSFKIGYDHRPHHFLVLIRGRQGGGAKVVVGCRYISDKHDLFKMFVKPSEERVARVAQAVDAAALLDFVTEENCQAKVGP